MVAFAGAISAVFGLGYWSKGISVDLQDRRLLKRVEQLSFERNNLELKIKTLSEENAQLKASIDQVAKVKEERWKVKLSLSKSEAERTTLENRLTMLIEENADLTKTVAELRKRVKEDEQRRALLSIIASLESERKDLHGRVEDGLDDLKWLKLTAAELKERCNFCKANGGKCAPDDAHNVCAEAAGMYEEALELGKAIGWRQNRLKSLENEIFSLQSKL